GPSTFPCFSDAHAGAYSNPYEDTQVSTTYWQNYFGANIGSRTSPFNYISLAFGTVGTLPSTANLAWVSDSIDGRCTTGGGSAKVWCRWTGSAWVPIGDGSSPNFGTPNIGAANGTSLAVTTYLTAG